MNVPASTDRLNRTLPVRQSSTCMRAIDAPPVTIYRNPIETPKPLKTERFNHNIRPATSVTAPHRAFLPANQNPGRRRRLSSTPLFPEA